MRRPPRRIGSSIAPGLELIEHIHRSRTFDVFDAWHEERECRCVVKALRTDRRNDADARRRLLTEGRLLADIRHPHIVGAYDVLSSPEPLVVLETLSGETLAHLVERRGGGLSGRELAFLGLHLCSAVGYLHRRGLLHLDLKPANIVAEAGRARLIDLSIARAPGLVRAGLGTWCYMAPEQCRGDVAGAAADVWGVGVVLWEAAAGDTPFGHESSGYPQLQERAPSLRTRRRLSGELMRAVDGCLAPAPSERPSLGELRTVLESVAGARG